MKGGPHPLGRADLDRLPRGEVRGLDPRTGTEAKWEGVSLAALVTERVELARGADTAVLRTSEQKAIPVPIPMIRALRPVLAERRDGERLGGRVVAWPNADQRGLATDPRAASWWATDVVAIEIVDWQRTYGAALAAPEGASDAARRGAGVFAESCIACHRLRGTGGERGPDLTTVAARMREAGFTGFLGGHAGWRERREPVPEDVGELWTFLRTVAATATPAAPSGAADAAPAEPPRATGEPPRSASR